MLRKPLISSCKLLKFWSDGYPQLTNHLEPELAPVERVFGVKDGDLTDFIGCWAKSEVAAFPLGEYMFVIRI